MANIIVGGKNSTGSAVFDASAKTVTFSGLGTVELKDIHLITNMEDNIIIFNFAQAGSGGSIASNVLTLDFDTTAMSDTDDLQIVFANGEPQRDYDIGADRIANVTPEYARYTDPQNLVTDSDIGTADRVWISHGSVLDSRGYSSATLFLDFTEGTDADRAEVRIVGKRTVDDVNEYELPIDNQQTYCFPNTNKTVAITLNLSNTFPFIEIQSRASLIGSPVSTITIDYTFGYGSVEENISPKTVITDTKDDTPIGFYFTEDEGTPPNTLLNATAIDDTQIVLSSVVTLALGTTVGIFSGASGENRFYFGNLTVAATATATLSLDAPLDFTFSAGDVVVFLSREMNVNGSVTPQVFSVEVGATSGLEIDLHRIMVTMNLSSAGDDGLFGNIAALTNGITLRVSDGISKNIFTVHDNGEWAIEGYDVDYPTRSGGGGTNGMRARITFGGEDKRGTVFRLRSGEKLEMIIRDDLTGLTRFRAMAQGHIRSDGE